jgi:hypothetical protein
VVLAFVGVCALCAWGLVPRQGASAYAASLGVQVAQSLVLLRVALADLLIVPVIVRSAWDVVRGRAALPRSTLRGPIIALLVVMAAATLVGYARQGAMTGYVLFNKDAGILFLVLASLALAVQLRSKADVLRLVNVFVVGGSVANALALIATALSVTVLSNPVYMEGNRRMYGWLLNPSSWGSFVAMVAALELPRFFDSSSRRLRALRAFNYSLLLLSLGLTMSRSTWLSMSVCGVVQLALLTTWKLRGRKVPLVPVLAAVAAVAFVLPVAWVAVVQWSSVQAVRSAPTESVARLQLRLSDACAVVWNPELCDRIPDDQIQAAQERMLQADRCARVWEASCSTLDSAYLEFPAARLANAGLNCVGGTGPRNCLEVLPEPVLQAAREQLASAATTVEVDAAPDTVVADRPGILQQPDGAMLNARGLQDRAAIIAVAWREYTATASTMLLGIGLGSFLATSADDFGVPLIIHNTPMWFLVEMGPAGLLTLVWMAGVIARNLWVTIHAGGEGASTATGLFLALAFWSAYALFNEGFYLRHFWLVLLAADQLYVHHRAAADAAAAAHLSHA